MAHRENRLHCFSSVIFFFFQAEDGIRDADVTEFRRVLFRSKFLQELHEKKKRLLNLKDLKAIPKPKGIKATLRDYQKEGLNWLVFLHENQLGGCLAEIGRASCRERV